MIKLLYYTLILALSGLPGAVNAADQICQSNSEIPASTPTENFTDHGNGTVTDTQTDLMWAKCAEGLSGGECLGDSETRHNWKEALDLANSSTLAGYDNWRLPNIKELRSIVEQQCYRPAINLDVFPNTPSPSSAKDDPGFWSASPNVWSVATCVQCYAWGVGFYDGNSQDDGVYKSNHPYTRASLKYVRLVRSEKIPGTPMP